MLEITENKEYKEFSDSWVMMSAVRDQIMVLGEAAKQIPPDICEEYPEVPWNNLAKTRDKLIHGYFRTDPHLLYMMASVRAKNLLPIITHILSKIKDNDDNPD